MNNKLQKIISTILVLALVAGCFVALPLANAAGPVAGDPGWKAEYSKSANKGTPAPNLYDRGNASGDKIPSNAHSADYPGLYFYWDDKQKDDGVLLVSEWVFDLFQDEYTYTLPNVDKKKPATEITVEGGFILTAKNSNNYWGFVITKATGKRIDTVNGVDIYAYAIPKQIQFINPNNGKNDKEDLKNINMVFIDGKYKDAKFEITKDWYNENGVHITDVVVIAELNKLLTFNNKYTIGLNVVKINDYMTAYKGAKITVTEGAIKGYKPQEGTKNSYTITVKYNDDPTKVIDFHNQKQWAKIEIKKIWLDNAGLRIEQPEGISATFNIVGASALLTTDYKSGVGTGLYEVKEGTYSITENPITGFDLVEIRVNGNIVPQATVTIAAGDTCEVVFVNQDPTPPRNPFKLLKNIKGTTFEAAFPEGYTMADFIEEVTFTLYEADGPNNPVDSLLRHPGVAGDVDADGYITFDSLQVELMQRYRSTTEGWYVVEEEYVPGSTAAKIFEVAAPLYIYFDGEYIFGDVDEFDYDALYKIDNGYGSGYVLGYPGLNNSGDIFRIGVTTGIETDKVYYDSYCYNAGSRAFAGESGLGCTGYLVASKDLGNHDYEAFVKAYNYIEDKLEGGLKENRAIVQIVTWILLESIDPENTAFNGINWNLINGFDTSYTGDTYYKGTDAKADVLEVIANYATYKSAGKIVDVVVLECEHGHDYYDCQPQIVPVYKGTHVFVNKLKTTFDVSFTKTKFGRLLFADADEFAFDLFQIENGAETFIETIYTKDGGVVATKLAPGNYVFREQLKTYAISGIDDYRLIWKALYPGDADGLYFTISATGVVTWDYDCVLDDDGNVILDNTFWNKSVMQWVSEIQTGAGRMGDEFDGGYIFFPEGVDASDDVIYEVTPPNCKQGGVIWFFYSKADGTKGEPLMDIAYTNALGHDHSVLSDVGDSLVCKNCGEQISWWELPEELCSVYLQLLEDAAIEDPAKYASVYAYILAQMQDLFGI
jgi:hypothetical protein